MDASKHKKNNRRWVRGALFSLLLLLSTAWTVWDSLFLPRGIRSTSVEIPNLCGTMLDTLEVPDWTEVEVEYRHDANAAAGVILSQSPKGGSWRQLTEANPHCRLLLTVSLGEESVTVPDLMGEDGRVAEGRLRELGLAVLVRRVEGAYPEGTVFDMEPRAGAVLPIGAAVTLVVSVGAPRESVRVPELRGLTRSEALVQLWLSGLSLGEAVELSPSGGDARVIRQSHPAGTLVLGGTPITLYIGADENQLETEAEP